MSDFRDLTGLPGAELLSQGLEDLASGKTQTPEALLVAMAPTKLSGLGVELPDIAWDVQEPELTLYALLQTTHASPYQEYNALRRRFFKLERALEARVHRVLAKGSGL